MMDIPTTPVAIVPLVLTVFNETLKKVFNIDTKYCVLVNWFGGIFLYLALTSPATITEIANNALIGFLLGNSAGGIYSGTKRVLEQ